MDLSRRLAAVTAAAGAVILCAWLASGYFEQKFLTTGPNGTQTPGALGTPYERVDIVSGNRHLDGYLVNAAGRCRSTSALLIFHGVGETISSWPKAQRFLYERCVSSLVFDYSGHGDSSRPGTIANLDEDAAAAYAYFAGRFGTVRRKCVLGHSMGNGAMLTAIAGFAPRPGCVVVASAFSSLRDLGTHGGSPRILMAMVPDYWDNVINVANVRSPLLVVESDADSVIPVAMGRRIFDAARTPKRLLIVHGFRHNALYRDPTTQWWAPILRFIKGNSQ